MFQTLRRIATVCTLAAPALSAHAAARRLAVADFIYVDSSGERRDQTGAHAYRMHVFMAALRHDLAAAAQAELVVPICGTAPCRADSADLTEASRKDDADLLLAGGVHKTSTLVQWAKATLIDVKTGRVLVDRTFTFRGDNDAAWRRGENFIAQEIAAAVPDRAAPAPIRIVVFPFELDDFSAGAAAGVTNPVDRGQIEAATAAARAALVKTGRYTLVDADKHQTDALRDCNGCEAAIARQLGAQQSLLGVVRRISQTEYEVRFAIRDAASGKIIASADSGLRMGAAYSWDRGARQLIADSIGQ
ncbi:MAG TPA: DUF2380 domain-containing protein [Acetobacteraceae bacterium]|nr:DUF2380 domain-containing protein [Acetobacteraceae bacterium]